MTIKSILAAALFFSVSAYSIAQNVMARHTVKKGETVMQIAQKYKITPHDIYQMNPSAKEGIKENEVVLIPALNVGKPQEAVTPSAKASTHTVKPKETMFGIARQYGVSVDALKQANPVLADGLKIGQVITIPGGPAAVKTEAPAAVPAPAKPAKQVAKGSTITHIVEPKETKFGIAKRYGISVAELERQNPGIVQNLPVGYKLVIGSDASEAIKPEPVVVERADKPVVTTEKTTTTRKTGLANYEVKPGETMYSLTQSLGLTEKELIEYNPNLKDGLKSGMILVVPGRGSVVKVDTPKADLTKSIVKGPRKQLVLLMPFNAHRITGDTLKSVTERLKKDAFLNMTLDFYSGALMAIDSAKTLGLNVDVRIYDSEESKASSAVADLVKTKNLKQADAIIGPFYQQYADKLAELLQGDNVPVISPMSKEAGKPYSNLFEAMPSEEVGKRAMFEYMLSKGGNVIIVSDPKRQANREFITANYRDARFAEVEENGSLNADKLKAMFVKDKPNFVVLDSERTGMILSVTNAMLNETANFNLQLAIIEPNETLDFEEISMKRLTILKLLYPSTTRENHTPEAEAFENAYRRENKVFPNQYAVRGFDVTFDTLLRLAQDKRFSESVAESTTEQIESRFHYSQKDDRFVNKGVYILQYNEDLTVKQVN